MWARKAHKVMQARRGKPEATLIIENANEIITLAGDNLRPRKREGLRDIGLIKNGSLVIREGRILSVGRDLEGSLERKGAEFIDASGKTVMPGFIDPHTHLVFAGSRENELGLKIQGMSYSDIAKRGGGIRSTMRATRLTTQEKLFKIAADRLTTMLMLGTTTIETKSGYGLRPQDEFKCLKVAMDLAEKHVVDVVSTFLGAHAIPPEFEGNPDGYLECIINEMLPVVADEEMAEFCDVFCEKGFFDLNQSRLLLKEGKTYGLGPKIHADELTDMGGARLAAEMEAISADHLERSSDEGLIKMGQKNVIGVLLPGASFSTHLEYVNARRVIDHGVPVALATDFNPNCWTKSMQFIISLACYKLKMYPEEAIVASTINAAHAIGRANEIGSLEPGKQADIIILDVENYKQIPYKFGHSHIEMVIKKGEIVHQRS